MRRLRFTKMHGAGNDFVVIDATRTAFDLSREQIARLADRHFGVGCDQVLVVEPARGSDADFRYRIFNADGGEVEQCGNGARCFVKFVHAKGLTTKTEIVVETLAGRLAPRLEPDGDVSVDMVPPRVRTRTGVSSRPRRMPDTTAAQAPVPQERVSPAPRSHTRNAISPRLRTSM